MPKADLGTKFGVRIRKFGHFDLRKLSIGKTYEIRNFAKSQKHFLTPLLFDFLGVTFSFVMSISFLACFPMTSFYLQPSLHRQSKTYDTLQKCCLCTWTSSNAKRCLLLINFQKSVFAFGNTGVLTLGKTKSSRHQSHLGRAS